ncbi:P-type conjugative transfer protein TrbG [Sphingomonas sp.]|uniref:P-type conjugative transfer protein TrbG n=1 Tax=Sphingomonas sp. TaxID=28214 RepID=UPI003D6C7EB1
MTHRSLMPILVLPLFALNVPAEAQQSPTPVTAAPTAAAPAPTVKPGPVRAAPRRPRPPRRSSPAEIAVRAANRAATVKPAAPGFINAVQVYPFADGGLYQVYAAPERVTDLALQPGEALVAVAAGDTVRWIIGDTTSGASADKRTHILVKPFAAGLSTNLVVTTDRRTYHLTLASTAGTAMVAVSWTYPQDALIALKRTEDEQRAATPIATGIAPAQLHFDYAITGDRPAWRPLRAFDDGRQTYIEFPANLGQGEAPPLFLIDAKNDAQLVNYRLQGRFYVVDRLFAAAELRLGLKYQDIVRITRAAPGAKGRRS